MEATALSPGFLGWLLFSVRAGVALLGEELRGGQLASPPPRLFLAQSGQLWTGLRAWQAQSRFPGGF